MLTAERDRTQADIDREASEWLARRRMTRLSAADEAAFERWSAEPRNATTFEAMSLTLEDISALSSLAALEPLEAAHRRPLTYRDGPRRRAIAAAGIGMAAAAAVAVAIIPTLDQPTLRAATRVAEVRAVTLPDGSRVTLGARSKINVRFEDGVRRVQLTDGEAFFEVVHDAARPFEVETGGTVIRDIGTKFDVKRSAGGVEVAVLEGSVRVQGRSILPGAQVRTLEAGQRVTATDARIGPIPTSLASVGSIETASSAAGAWRSGQLTYDDTRLADVVADLNRYYGPGVKLQPGTLADTRLAASFKVGEIDKFLAELPTVAPVEVTRGPGGAVTIVPRAGDGAQG